MAKEIRDTELVRVKTEIKNKVAKKVIGTKVTIGEFYDAAVIDKLKSKKIKL